MDKALAGARKLRNAIIRAMDYAGTLPAKEAVKLRPGDWNAVIDLGRELADKVEAAALPADTAGLVERLRGEASAFARGSDETDPGTASLIREAADRVEALECANAAKDARLAEAGSEKEADHRRWTKALLQAQEWRDRAEKAEAALAAEREAYAKIERERESYYKTSFEAAKEWLAAWLDAAQTAEQSSAKNRNLSPLTRPDIYKAISALCKEIGREICKNKALEAAIVAEREACAKVAVLQALKTGNTPRRTPNLGLKRDPLPHEYGNDIAAAIRARGGRDE